MSVTPLGSEKCIKWLLWFFPFKDLNMKNENVHDLKHGVKQPLSELKISQAVRLIVKDVTVTERKMNVKNISC